MAHHCRVVQFVGEGGHDGMLVHGVPDGALEIVTGGKEKRVRILGADFFHFAANSGKEIQHLAFLQEPTHLWSVIFSKMV